MCFLLSGEMEQKSALKQFNLSHLRVDEKLQGARLASFSRRFLAYALDWIIIIVCTEFIYLVIPLFLLLLLFRGKLHSTLTKSRRIIKKNVLHMGRKLEENTTITPALKKQFTRNMVIYIYLLLYFPVLGSILYLLLIFLEFISPQDYHMIQANFASIFHLLSRPVLDLTDGLGLISRFFGAFLYFSIFTWKWQGQTPAKRLLRICIVKLDGTGISFWNSFERTSGYTASTSIVFLGFLQYFWDRNAQTTHDKIAETIVIEV